MRFADQEVLAHGAVQIIYGKVYGSLSTLEQLKVARWQHKEILTIEIGDGLALRSAQRIEAIKAFWA